MNTEKQYSEYKTIETVATPTFDGVSVETHPEDLLEGGDIPVNLKIPFDDNIYAAGKLEGKIFNLYGAENNLVLLIKNVNGEVSANFPAASTMLQQYIIPKIKEKGYDVENSVIDTTSYKVGDIISNWEQYINIF